jgi:hypothetical protein
MMTWHELRPNHSKINKAAKFGDSPGSENGPVFYLLPHKSGDNWRCPLPAADGDDCCWSALRPAVLRFAHRLFSDPRLASIQLLALGVFRNDGDSGAHPPAFLCRQGPTKHQLSFRELDPAKEPEGSRYLELVKENMGFFEGCASVPVLSDWRGSWRIVI